MRTKNPHRKIGRPRWDQRQEVKDAWKAARASQEDWVLIGQWKGRSTASNYMRQIKAGDIKLPGGARGIEMTSVWLGVGGRDGSQLWAKRKGR